MKSKNLSLLILIILLAIFLRFFRLGDIPAGLYQDETAIGYNAFSLIETGKDEYGKSYPLYFKSFGDQKLPVYIYSSIVPLKIFGLTPFAVRFSSAFFGVLSVLALFLFIRDLTKNDNLAIFSSLFLAINPWSLHYNRATFEVSMSLFFFIAGGFLLNRFFVNKNKGALVAGTIFFIVSLYSYNLTRLLAPLLFLLFVLWNRKHIKMAQKGEIILAVFIGFLLLVPFVVSIFTSGGVSSASGTLIFSSAVVQAPLLELRAYMIGLPFGLPSLFFNKYLLTFWHYLNNIASYFSSEFFFIKGSTHGNHGIGNVGQFYFFEILLIPAGFLYMIKKKISGAYLLTGWGVLTILIAALTREAPHATRSFFLVVPLTVFSAAGAIYLWQITSRIVQQKLKYFILASSIFLITFNLIFYFASYYVRFPLLYAEAWRVHDRELVSFIAENDNRYDKIVIDNDAGLIYTSLLFYLQYPPSQFQQSVSRFPDDKEGFSKVKSFGKYEFRSIDWDKDRKLQRTLFVVSPEKTLKDVGVLRTINFPKRPVVFAEEQQIFQIPLEDPAYVLVETK